MSNFEKGIVLFFRLTMGWTFLWAGYRQVFLTDHFTVASFLSHTKTFHDVFSVFMLPSVVGFTSFLVKWGHLLIGLSLIAGLLSFAYLYAISLKNVPLAFLLQP